MDNLDELMGSEDATWRDILNSVLQGLDPWNVDVIELATRYSKKVDEMRDMNFRIPANVVLVCSVLLRMKADILTPKVEEYSDFSASLNFIFNSDYPIAALLGGESEPYPIAIKPARELTRRVTAAELIEAIQGALEDKTKHLERAALRASKRLESSESPTELVLEPDINILELIEKTYEKVMQILGARDVAMLSELAKTKEEVIHTFLSLLHLSNGRRVDLSQEQLFGEIYIRPVPN